MKTFLNMTLAVTLAATATASASHGHGHRHLHGKKDASKVEKRQPDVVTKIVAGPIDVVYKLGDNIVDPAAAKAGIENGEFVIVGESTPTYTPPPVTTTSTPVGGQFIETKSTTTTTTTTTTTPPPPPPTTTSTRPPPPPSSTAKPPVANAASSNGNGSGGVDSDFPSGTIPCSEFPSQYGAVAADWLNLGGWFSIQEVPDFSTSLVGISNIVTGIAGQNCSPMSFCSYGCGPGLQKSQWPAVQGLTGQSVGGLWCNSQGYLELSRPSVKQICIPGEGGVSIQNDLDESVATCRTNYPGDEGMYDAIVAGPGAVVPVTNPSQSDYYQWKQMKTSAQYYINPKGVPVNEACVWTNPKSPTDTGNWASTNLGVGMADDGTTFISLFLNKPTSNALPGFNMEILGGNSQCAFKNGAWIGGELGCTTGVAKGQKAIVRFF